MQCFSRKQTCNGEYTKHCTRSRHQLKMAAPAEVSEKRSNLTILRKTPFFNIAANLTLNTMASFVILLTARTARIACSDRHTYRQTDTRDNYCNPLCACAPRVNNYRCKLQYAVLVVMGIGVSDTSAEEMYRIYICIVWFQWREATLAA